MQIVYMDIENLIPYEKNPRNNTKAVKGVMNSIKSFGMKNPILIDKNNIIINGHTRYKALKNLGGKKVPCIIADDLTEKEIKALRLADNKVAEKATWDYGLLEIEINDVSTDFDMVDFGFNFDVSARKEANKRQELKTVKTYNMLEFDADRAEGKYQIPMLEPCDVDIDRWIGFNYAKSSNDYEAGIHFYLDDYQFERIWTSPQRYIDILKQYSACMSPAFSVYLDMSVPLQIWNVFRTRLLSQMMQDNGLKVIPIVYWGDRNTFDFCFDGLPTHSTLSTYFVGCDEDIWKAGMDELIRRKKPKKILLYGNGKKPNYDFKNIEVVYIKNEVTERMKGI